MRGLVREEVRGLGLTLLGVLAIEALVRTDAVPAGRAFPGVLLAPAFVAVVYAAFAGGLRGGLLSSGVVTLYAFYYFWATPADVHPLERAARAAVIGASALCTGALVGVLKRRLERAHEAALEAQRRESERLAAANAELTHANRSLQAFSYVVSHDLKEPSRTMESYLAFLDEDAGPSMDPESRELLRQARLANARLLGLVDSLLELGRAARVDPASLTACSIADAMEDPLCTERYRRVQEARGARVEIAEGIPPVRASRDMLCQVLGNLVLNALKHHPGAGCVVRVSGRALGDGLVEVLVEDNGPGFPKGILERFSAADSWDNLPSTSHPRGFGLTIAARAVEGLGGRIGIGRSETLGGAQVRLELPAASPRTPSTGAS
jgi:signal transduction histidine kinase